MNLGLQTRGEMTLAAIAALAILAMLYGSVVSVEPAWILAAISAGLLALLAMRRWPLVVLTALLFVGNFKTTAAHDISFTDPTVILLLLAAGAIFLELLFVVSGDSEWSLEELFRGQQLGVICFLIFVAVVALSYLYTVAPHYGAVKLSRFVSFKPLVFIAPLILLKRDQDVRQLLVTFFILGLTLTAKDIYLFLHPTREILRGNADPTQIGDAQLIGMTLMVLLFSPPFRKFSKILGLVAVLFLTTGLAVCTARGPLVSTIFVLVTYSLAARKVRTFVSYKQILGGLVLFIIVLMGAVSWVERFPSVQAKISEKQQELVAFFHGARDPGGTMERRLEFYRSAASAFAESPFSGWGVGGWPVLFYGYEKEDYPHNLILEVAAEQGAVGLAALFAFLATVWLAARQIWHWRPDLAFPVPLFAYSLLACMFSSDLNTRSLWFWCGTIFAMSRMCCARTPDSVPISRSSPRVLAHVLEHHPRALAALEGRSL